nr:MAG TPA: DEDDh [Caudoviricetes sp.]
MITSNYLVHDCETGGLDPTVNPITQYACIVLDGKTLKELDRFETFVKPYGDLTIDDMALKKTMVTMSDIKNGVNVKSFVETAKDLWTQYQGKSKYKDARRLISVGHNITFDHGFLEYAFLFCKAGTIFDLLHDSFIDTLPLTKLAFGVNGDEKITLSDAVRYSKLKITDAHGAMNDVEANADYFRWIMKKLRSKRGEAAVEREVKERVKGSEFFEFKCGGKNPQ